MSEPDFGQVCNQFREFRAILGQALAAPGDAAVKQRLRTVTASLDQNFAELQTSYPKALASIDAQLAGAKQSAAQTTAKLAGLKEQIAAAEAQATQAIDILPVPTPADPDLGQKLREEILERFGRPSVPEGVPASAEREIWQDWDWQNWSNN